MGRRGGLGALSQQRERAAAQRAVDQLGIKIGSLTDTVDTLSGGNQQKVVVGKWLLTEPRVVLLDDPTKGIDVRAKEELYEVVGELVKQGVAVILNSSDDEGAAGAEPPGPGLLRGPHRRRAGSDERTPDRLVAASMQVVV